MILLRAALLSMSVPAPHPPAKTCWPRAKKSLYPATQTKPDSVIGRYYSCMRESEVMNAIKDRIAEHPFLKGLSSEHLDVLARHAREVEFKEGQILFRENESAYAFFLLVDGRVALESYVPRG